MNRKALITCAVLFIVICLCLSILAIVGAGFIVWESENKTSTAETQEQPNLSEETDESLTPAPETPSYADDPSDIDPGTLVEMEMIQRQVIHDRGLEPSGMFTRTLLTRDQLRQRVMEDFLEDYSEEEAQEDGLILDAFGLLNANFDLYNFYLDLLSEQVAGFYDNETKEMVVVQGSDFSGTERLTYAHEYTHALQDHNYDIRDGLNYSDEACENDSERCAAVQSLIEGDASLSELNWFLEHANAEDRSDILNFYDSFEQPIMDSAPAFISEDFLFPYEYGLNFVQTFYDRGGWEAVDQIYSNLPVSTEQILHPEKYPHDKPIPVKLPNLTEVLGDDWAEIDQDVMGEWYIYLILAHGLNPDARLDSEEAANAAQGWGGDAYRVLIHTDSGATVMVLRTIWETSIEADEFVTAFEAYARERFDQPQETSSVKMTWQGDDEVHVLQIEPVYTTWILAPDEVIANLVWDAILAQ
jgi:hypothetical protein